MPPDISSGPRLEKIIRELEDEARKEDKIAFQEQSFVPRQGSSPGNYLLKGQIEYVKNGAFSFVWSRLTFFMLMQILYFIAFYELLFGSSPTAVVTWLFGWTMGLWSGLGVTAGSHRLWAHKSYQAKWPLRVFLMLGHCLSGQNSLYNWCRDHRFGFYPSMTMSNNYSCLESTINSQRLTQIRIILREASSFPMSDGS